MTIPNILVIILAIIWLCFSIVFLMTAVQSFIYDRKRKLVKRKHKSVTLNITKAQYEGIQQINI